MSNICTLLYNGDIHRFYLLVCNVVRLCQPGFYEGGWFILLYCDFKYLFGTACYLLLYAPPHNLNSNSYSNYCYCLLLEVTDCVLLIFLSVGFF